MDNVNEVVTVAEVCPDEIIVLVFLSFQRLSITVKTDGALSLEENMRQNLLACYSEFADILKQMAVTHVSIT